MKKKYTKEETIKILLDLKYFFKTNIIDNLHRKLDQNRKVFEIIQIKYPDFMTNRDEMFFLQKNNQFDENMICSCNFKKSFGRNNKYRFFCSRKCKANDKQLQIKTQKKIKETNLIKYGVENVFQVEEIKEKCKKTLMTNYGVNHPSKSNKIKNKVKDTMLERYGVEYAQQSQEIREKVAKTNIERYGVECVLQHDKTKEKIKDTNIERYGNKSPSKTQYIKDKTQETIIKKYGQHHSKIKKVQDKLTKTNIERYGVKSPLQNKEILKKTIQTNIERYGCLSIQRHLTNFENHNEEYIRANFIKNGYFLAYDFCEYFNCSWTHYHITCQKYNIIERHKIETHQTQNKIYDWLYSLYSDAINNDRKILKGKELDIYIPSKQLAIEYDGIMFHSFGNSSYEVFNNAHLEDKNQHISKTNECEKQDIQLLHIFENEWLENKQLWQSMIKSKLGLNKRIFARKCEIREITNKEKSIFLVENHLQGDDKSSIKLGLFYENKLVSVMTFGKARYNKKYQYELIRFCSLQNLTIVGGASKLLVYFKRVFNPTSIISYANRRWSNGNLYKQLGFTQTHISPPNYFYFKQDEMILHSREKFQKHKLEKKLDVYDVNLTERQNMYNNGYRKIFDCGNLVFEMILDSI